MQLTIAVFESLWPLVHKFWSKRHERVSEQKQTRTEYFSCRHFREQARTKGQGRRDRRIELAIECKKKIKVFRALTGATTVRIELATDDEHTGHTQEDTDVKKRTTFIKDTVAAE